MKNKAFLITKVFIAIIIFNISGLLISEIFAFFIQNCGLSKENVVLFYKIGCNLITIFISAPLYMLFMGAKKKKWDIRWNVSEKISWLKHLFNLLTALLPVFILYIVFILFMGSEALINDYSVVELIFIIISSCVVMPLIEEIMFRDYMLFDLAKEGKIFAVIITSVCFALGHNNLINAIIGFADGIIFSIIALKAGGIKNVYFYHCIVNFIGNIVIPEILKIFI